MLTLIEGAYLAIEYKLHSKPRLLVTQLSDVVTYDAFYATYKAILAEAGDWAQILEISLIPASVTIQITPQALRDLAERLSTALAERELTMKTAFIAPSDAHYGLASVYRAQAAFNGTIDITVLRDAQEGLRWLGIDSAVAGHYLPAAFG